MMFDLTGKKAIVTGASRITGLCFAQAQALREAGATVVILGGSPENLSALRANLNAEGSGYYILDGDLTNKNSREGAFLRAIELLGGSLDILVNGAGTQFRCPAVDFPVEKWERIIDINLSVMFYLSQLAGRVMLPKRSGKIINIASMNSFFGGHIVAAYAASKGGVAQLTKALSNEWMPYGINVNAIAPGYMETELSHDLKVSEAGVQITRRIPAGRWGKAEDMKGITVFLASRASDYLSGNIIQVDGGYLCN